MRNLFFLLLLSCSFPGNLFSQSEVKQTDMMFALRAGVHVNRTPFYELGGFLFFTHGQTSDGPSGWGGVFYSVDKSFQKSELNHGKQIQGWNAGLEYDRAFPWGFRCGLSGFKIDGKQTLKLCPEAGISIYCYHVYFGYNIPLTNKNLIRNNGPQLSLYFGVPVLWHTFESGKKNHGDTEARSL